MSSKKKKHLAHVRLYNWVLITHAYRSLSPGARALLVELYALHNGTNNGWIFLSVREAANHLAIIATDKGCGTKELIPAPEQKKPEPKTTKSEK